MIGIIDYGLGNLGSVLNMIRKLDFDVEIVVKSDQLSKCSKIILPGVGAFDTGMQSLKNSNWIEPLNEVVMIRQIPILGICLGMQLMTRKSEEGNLNGLGWINADVIKFTKPTQRVPHMGWNTVTPVGIGSPILGNVDQALRFYFVHSYHVKLNNVEDQIGATSYGIEFVSAFQRNNIYGVQFHPEKSHRYGMTLLRNFANL